MEISGCNSTNINCSGRRKKKTEKSKKYFITFCFWGSDPTGRMKNTGYGQSRGILLPFIYLICITFSFNFVQS